MQKKHGPTYLQFWGADLRTQFIDHYGSFFGNYRRYGELGASTKFLKNATLSFFRGMGRGNHQGPVAVFHTRQQQ